MADRTPWHALTLETVRATLRCGLDGLPQAEAARRLAEFGENKLPEAPPTPRWRIFLRQFAGPLIFVLLVAAGVSLLVGSLDDTVFIVMVLLFNATIGYLQESKAEKDIRGLAKLLVTHARVRRGGETLEVPGAALVPGDLVLLESGMKVPADLRLLEAQGLRVDESLHTGESTPVEKRPSAPVPEASPPSDRPNMLFSGTVVFQGRAQGLVVGTGLNTEVGLIAQQVQRHEEVKPPLLVRMERFSRSLALLITVLCAAAFAAGLWRGDDWVQLLMVALALAVAAIPEGLPVALTIALAIGGRRMALRNVLVRRLEAVEALGSCSVIASDKTGTLTTNQLTAVEGVLAGEPFAAAADGKPGRGVRVAGAPARAGAHPALERLCRAGVLCNEATPGEGKDGAAFQGDPTDVALLVLAGEAGLEPAALDAAFPRANAIPFEPENRFAASFHHLPSGGGLAVVKGAPEVVFAMCDTMWQAGSPGPVPFDEARAEAWADGLAGKGHRVLALAEQEAPAPPASGGAPARPAGLTLVGLVGMSDPPRSGVAEAIARCHRAGIRVMMVTGDHLKTATIIAERIGLLRGPARGVIDGAALDRMGDRELAETVAQVDVIGRATPTTKMRVIEALQAGGEFIAVTGDGVNDAPALRAANIGVAMGRAGTDIAREASDLVITDDNFASIVAGVEEGRIVYENVRKVIFMLVSTGVGEVMVVLLAMLFGFPVPFLAVQLLWMNLVTEGAQGVALAFEPREGDELRRPPRPAGEPVFNRLMIERVVLVGLVLGGVSFAFFAWLIQSGQGVEQARGLLLNLFVAVEILHLGNSRSETRSLFVINPFSNRFLWLGTVGAILVHGVALQVPLMQTLLDATMPSLAEWGVILGLSSSVVVAVELHKLLRRVWGGKTTGGSR